MRRMLVNATGRRAWYFYYVCICLLLCLLVLPPYPCKGESLRGGNEYLSVSLAENPSGILRFHVRADSNTLSDQQIKNEVASRILERFSPAWRECDSREELNLLLAKEQEAMAEIAKQTLQEQGFEQDVLVLLERSIFPARLYEDNYYPPGEYESLLVVLGSGKGENWWCVIFPPLCFNVIPAPPCGSEQDHRCHTEQESPAVPPVEMDRETNVDDGRDENKWRFWIVDYFKQDGQKKNL